jgi:hypothetical protein
MVVVVAIVAIVAIVLVDGPETVDGLVPAIAVFAGAIAGGGRGVSALTNGPHTVPVASLDGLVRIAYAPGAAVVADRAAPSPAVFRVAVVVVAFAERSIGGGTSLLSLLLWLVMSGGLRMVRRRLVVVVGRLSVQSKDPHPVG